MISGKNLKWILFLGVIDFFLFCPSAFASQVYGIMTVVKGPVTVKSGKNGKEEKAKMGMKVFPRDAISTQSDARAKIVMVDKNEINVSPNSHIVIENYEFDPEKDNKKVLIDVLYGKVRSKVEQKYDGEKNKFQVKTPSAVAGVRGTDFFTSFNQLTQSSKVITFKGEVAFGLPGPGGTILNPVSVKMGEFTVNTNNSPPAPPAPMPKSELNKFDFESKAEGPESTGTANSSGGDGKSVKPEKGPDKNQEESKKGMNNDSNENKKSVTEKENQNSNGGASRRPAGDPQIKKENGPTAGMMRPEDFASTPNMPTPFAGVLPPSTTPFFSPPPLPGHNQIICEFCREVIQDGTTKLNVKIIRGN